MPLVIDFRWRDDLVPVFQVAENGIFSELPVVRNTPFFLTVAENPQKCTGSLVKGEYSACPTHEIGTKKCETCKRADDYFPCQFCNGFNCSQFRTEKIENCDAEHAVYLALFTEDLVKVGVSRLSRGMTRQVEQGSHFTRIFAEGLSGVAARRLEKTLMNMGFPDKIPASQKKDFLFPAISEARGRAVLEQKKQEAYDFILSEAPEYKKYILTEEKFWNMIPQYGDELLFSELSSSESGFQKPLHFLSLTAGESFGGMIRIVKGPFLVGETPEERVVLLAKDLVGYTVSFAPCPEGLRTNAALQSSLF